LQRCSVTGITSNSIVVSSTRSWLNGRDHSLESLAHPRYHALQMVPKHALTSITGCKRPAPTLMKA
jgi:hypothetical protein